MNRLFCYQLEYHPAFIIVAEDKDKADDRARLHGAVQKEQYVGEIALVKEVLPNECNRT